MKSYLWHFEQIHVAGLPSLLGSFAIISAIVCVLSFYASRSDRSAKTSHQLPLPPGPKPWPIVGNLLDVPRAREWETLTKWRDIYGDLVYINVLGRSIIYVNSAEAATELFARRSAIYSDRPRLPLLNDMMGMEFNFGFMPYGDKWKEYRRVFSSKFGASAVKGFCSIQEDSTRTLLRRIRDSPDHLFDHLQLHVVHTIVKSTYGADVETINHRYVCLAHAVMESVSKAAKPGAWLVDSLPFLKHIPEWVPFASVQRLARTWRKNTEDHIWEPFNAVKAEMAAAHLSETKSFMHDLLEHPDGDVPNWEQIVRETAAVAFGGGSDTTLAAVRVFVVAMVKYPEVQQKAQEELDNLLSTSRLPTFSDSPKLPYVSAIVKEVLRWHTIAPQGLPHCVREDDEYDGYRIPAGTLIVSNLWGILHDERTYGTPSVFNPDRFVVDGKLDYSSNDPSRVAFGYGRRVCPGVHFAENMLWITIACLLSAFRFEGLVDEDGKPIPVELNPCSGMIATPGEVKCRIHLRGTTVDASDTLFSA